MRAFLLVLFPACALAAFVLHHPTPVTSAPPEQPVAADAPIPADWKTLAPRDEIRPKFAYDSTGGPKKTGAFVITADDREGLHGWFQKSFPVTGDKHYQFRAVRKVQNVVVPRRSASVRILWRDDNGRPVPMSEAPVKGYLKGFNSTAEAEHPTDRATGADGWTEVTDTYRAPTKATQAVVELHLMWAPGGKIEWADVALTEVPAPKPRNVRLATIHYKPSGKSIASNREEFAPLIE